MKGSSAVLYLATCLAGLHVVNSQVGPQFPPFVRTNLGGISGTPIPFGPRILGPSRDVRAYLGIPYAKPPVGVRRFRKPEPIDPWQTVLDATAYAPACPQLRPDYRMSEDCLYLNVFVPSTTTTFPQGNNLPVMVFVHGGGFTSGSGNEFPINPVPLAELGDVIVVTLNYRLNILGFFTTGDDAIPGNLGLWDQRLALQWVQENIAAFGGDTNRITLFGESAGSVCVGMHVVTEGSRRYFKRAIMESGTPYTPFGEVLTEEEISEYASVVAEVGGCGSTFSRNIEACLRGKSIPELLNIQLMVNRRLAGQSVWVPANDGDFFPSDVYESLVPFGDYSGLELIIGVNEQEGAYNVWLSTGRPYDRPFLSRRELINMTVQTDDPTIVGTVEAVYADGIEDDGNYLDATVEMLTDVAYACGVNRFMKTVAERGAVVYAYVMTMASSRSILNATWVGSPHLEELQFVFGLPFLDDRAEEPIAYRDLKFSYYFMQLWANFAKTGNPNFPNRLLQGSLEWPRFLNDMQMYKELDLKFSNDQGFRHFYCNFWDVVFPNIISLTLQAAAAGNGGARP